MDKLLLLHKPIKYLLFSYLMQIKMIIMLLVFFEIANQIDKSDERPPPARGAAASSTAEPHAAAPHAPQHE